MTHRAESILDAMTTAVTGLATTGTNVERGRVWPVATLPALTVAKGADIASDGEDILPTLVREMTVSITAHITQLGNPETALHAIAAELFAAIRANPTLGLAYVFDCELIGDDAPEISDSHDLPVAAMVSNWRVLYEHSKSDAEN